MSTGRMLRVYSPGIVVIFLSLLLPFTGDAPVSVAGRGVLIGVSLLVSTREKMTMWRERRDDGKPDDGSC